jgi:hypothetical protein
MGVCGGVGGDDCVAAGGSESVKGRCQYWGGALVAIVAGALVWRALWVLVVLVFEGLSNSDARAIERLCVA